MNLFRIWLEIKSAINIALFSLTIIIVITWILILIVPKIKSYIQKRRRRSK